MDNSQQPVQCTLAPKEEAAQILEWTNLRRHAVASEALANGVQMMFPIEHRESLEMLVAREATCCSFLDLSLQQAGEFVTLQVTSENPDAHSMIAMISGVETK